MKGELDLVMNIIRWILLVTMIFFALFHLNGSFFSYWAAGGPPTDFPNVWRHQGLVRFGYSIASFCVGMIFFKTFKKGFSFRKNKMIFVWFTIFIMSLSWPPIKQFIDIDSCLDNGGQWSEEYYECNT